jgi:hypothetical protein
MTWELSDLGHMQDKGCAESDARPLLWAHGAWQMTGLRYDLSGRSLMRDMNPDLDRLRQQFAGSYVAWLGDEVFLSAETYDELCDRLDQMPIDQGRIVIGYIERSDVLRIGLDRWQLVPVAGAGRNVLVPVDSLWPFPQ